MIIIDGNRALSKLWFAKKKLAQIIELDLPAKSAIINGFVVSVHQQDDITGGRIKSPMGMVVYCSKDTGLYCCNADFFGGTIEQGMSVGITDARIGDGVRVIPFNKYEVPYTEKTGEYIENRLYEVVDTGEKFYAGPTSPIGLLVNEYEISRVDPYVYGLPGSPDYTTVIYFTSSPITQYWSASNCRPVAFPLYNAEGMAITLSVRSNKTAESASSDMPKTYEMQIQAYHGNGSETTRRGWGYEQEQGSLYLASHVTFNLPSEVVRSVQTFQGPLINKISGTYDVFFAVVYEGKWDTWSLLSEEEKATHTITESQLRVIPGSSVLAGIPIDLRGEIQVGSTSYSSVVGSYSYTLDKDSGITLLTTMFTLNGTLSSVTDGEDRKWRTYYTIYQDGPDLQNPSAGSSVTTVNAEGILGVLDLLYSESHPGEYFATIGSTNPVEYATFPSMFQAVPATYSPGDQVDLSDIDFNMHTQRSYANIFTTLGSHMAYPNSGSVSRCRSDSIMFHGPDGIYTWTRRYGIAPNGSCRLVKFGTTGLQLIPCVMPPEIMYTQAEEDVLTITNDIEIFKRDSRPNIALIETYCGGPTPSHADTADAARAVWLKETDLYNARRALSLEYNSDRYNEGDKTFAATLEATVASEITALAILKSIYNNMVASQTYPSMGENPYSPGTEDYDLWEAVAVEVEAARAALPGYQAGLLARQNLLADAIVTVAALSYRAIGVRPNITYAGNDVFVCVCEKVNEETLTGSVDKHEVIAVYTGSPFTTWTKAPAFETGKLLHVRPVFASAERLVLLGVCEFDNPDTGIPVRHATMIDTASVNPEWIVLSGIPIKYHNRDMWDIAVYGNGEYVQMLRNYPSRPSTVPQYIRQDYVAESTIENSL